MSKRSKKPLFQNYGLYFEALRRLTAPLGLNVSLHFILDKGHCYIEMHRATFGLQITERWYLLLDPDEAVVCQFVTLDPGTEWAFDLSERFAVLHRPTPEQAAISMLKTVRELSKDARLREVLGSDDL